MSFSWNHQIISDKESDQPMDSDSIYEINHHSKRDIILKELDSTDQKEKPFTLSNINLEIKQGELVCIVGTVGSGKTSLLLANEMKSLSKSVPLLIHCFR